MDVSVGIENQKLLLTIDKFDLYYSEIDRFIKLMIIVLENTLASDKFSQAQIDANVSAFRGIQSSYQASIAGFSQYEAGARALFATVL